MSKKVKICPICGRSHTESTTLCKKHYNQMQKYGKTLDTNPRNSHDPNQIRIFEDYAEIDTYDVENNVDTTFKFDLQDLPLLQNKKWRAIDKRGKKYLGTGHTIYFHRLVCKVDDDVTVDHINNDTTDNRRQNLRAANASLQQFNQQRSSSNTSGIVGVTFRKSDKKWQSELRYKHKRYYGIHTDTFEESVFVRMLLEQLIVGELLMPIDEYAIYTNKITMGKKQALKKFVENKYNKNDAVI